MTNEQRLISLFESCCLASDGLNYGEIKAYCAGLDCVKQQIDGWKDHLPKGKVMIPADMENIHSAFEGCTYTVNGNTIIFTRYDIKTIGKKCEDWIRFNMNIELGADGLSWGQIHTRKASWNVIHSRRLRWSMIRSVKNGEYI